MDKELQIKVLSALKGIPQGKVVSYKELGRKFNIHPRAIARILASNPEPVKIPCHRVVYSCGKVGGYTPSGEARKIDLLRLEGVEIKKDRIDKKFFYHFK
jgi:methylated-DNA-[protein]-cysteine S-methyltransferase